MLLNLFLFFLLFGWSGLVSVVYWVVVVIFFILSLYYFVFVLGSLFLGVDCCFGFHFVFGNM